ncbi:unnamed protein product, partial [Allacma fusca]
CYCWFPIIHGKSGYGVPQHFGVFYSMGLALIIEGFLSAAYHVCPNQNNFQFDTCFMYVISVLTLVKVYQFRHPVALDANQVFAILAGIILVSVAGLMLEFSDSASNLLLGFRIIFTTGQFLLILSLSVYFYSLGYVKDDNKAIVTGWSLFAGVKQIFRRPVHTDRLILPFISILLSIGVVIYSEMEKADFATYLLYTFIANVLGFCLYYMVIMKPLHGEFKNFSWVQPTFYFVACGIIGGFAVMYFVQSPAKWEKSASESRSEDNMECMNSWFPFQPFYDVHDVWHFYSAAALFLAFMGLLTVDDDLVATPQSRIPVF